MTDENKVNQDALDPEGNQDTLNPEENLDSNDLDSQKNESSDDSGKTEVKPEEVAKLQEYAKNQKIRAEKAEKELKALKAKLKESETPKNSDEQEKSNEPDYAKEAFLEIKGIKHPDDKKLVYDEAKRLNLPLSDVLQMEHIQAKLKKAQEQREAEAGMPQGSGKSGGVTKGDVEYWIDRKNPDGTYATPDDLELAEKVIEARIKRDQEKNKFSEELY